jgi:hypothetical protein
MRFNPARFNIYYIAGILVAGITTALFLNTPSQNSDNLNPVKPDTSTYLNIEEKQPVRKEPDKSIVNRIESKKSSIVTVLNDKSGSMAAVAVKSPENRILTPTEPNKSFSKNGFFSDGSAGKNKLQSGFKSEALLIDPYASVGCAPFKLRFYNKSTSYDSCRWTFGDGGYSNEKNPEWIFDVEGEYNVVLEVFSRDGRHQLSSASVIVHPRPKASFEIAPEKAVVPHDEIRFLNYSANAVQFKWDFGDGTTSEFFEPRHKYAKFGNYNVGLVVFSDWGCSDSITVLNAFSGSEYFIDFPNAFIPNAQGPTGGFYSSKSDEAAQVFHPSSSGVSDYQLKIFSKLGIPIFESSDIYLGWDGYNKGELCEPGVYIWKVRGKFRNGEPFIKMGDVTLLKN